VSGIDLHIDEASLQRLADLVAERIVERFAAVANPTPYLSAGEAAAYIGAPVSRVRKLTMTGDLPVHRDGRRTLYRREELDGYIARGGATSP
jgi:excisionase family DNA binding protein